MLKASILQPLLALSVGIAAAEPPIIEAARANNLEVLKQLLEQKGAVHLLGSDHQTALHEAARNCSPEAARILLAAGVDASVQDNAGRTAGMLAVRCEDPAVMNTLVRMLLVAPPRPREDRAQSSNKWAPLQDAAAHGQVEVVAMLLKLHADVNDVDSKGDRALEIACRKGDARMARVLLEHGADVKLPISAGTSILHEAALGGSAEVIDMLVERGASVNALDKDLRSTPLHYAASFGRVDAVKALLRHGADKRLRDGRGRTPLDAAVGNDQDEVAELLAR